MSTPIADQLPEIKLERLQVGEGTILHRGCWPDSVSLQAFSQLARLPRREWEYKYISIYGRSIRQPRQIDWAGTKSYTYSGLTLPPKDYYIWLGHLNTLMSKLAGNNFNHVLLNRYNNGNEKIGLHADNEPELGKDPIIASLSFGVARSFQLVPNNKKLETLTFQLGDGDVLIMAGSCQREYKHCVPAEPLRTGVRVNLTFRKII